MVCTGWKLDGHFDFKKFSQPASAQIILKQGNFCSLNNASTFLAMVSKSASSLIEVVPLIHSLSLTHYNMQPPVYVVIYSYFLAYMVLAISYSIQVVLLTVSTLYHLPMTTCTLLYMSSYTAIYCIQGIRDQLKHAILLILYEDCTRRLNII